MLYICIQLPSFLRQNLSENEASEWKELDPRVGRKDRVLIILLMPLDSAMP